MPLELFEVAGPEITAGAYSCQGLFGSASDGRSSSGTSARRATGGCRDGLHPDRAKENQGAESTLSFVMALLEMRKLEEADGTETALESWAISSQS